MNIKDLDAPLSTTTIDKNLVDAPTDNIYEAISIIAKRATQINTEIKKELTDKLDEFATFNDTLAVQEWLEDRIYSRDTSITEEETND